MLFEAGRRPSPTEKNAKKKPSFLCTIWCPDYINPKNENSHKKRNSAREILLFKKNKVNYQSSRTVLYQKRPRRLMPNGALIAKD